MAIEVTSQQAHALNLSQLMQGVDADKKYDDKSLRLVHKGGTTGNGSVAGNVQLKIHTSFSRLGYGGESRATKRQDALDLVKTALINEFHGMSEMADTALASVGRKHSDRISLGELRELKTQVDAMKAVRGHASDIVSSTLRPLYPHDSKIAQAFASVVGFLANNHVKEEDFDMEKSPGFQSLISKMLDGTPEQSKAAVAMLKHASPESIESGYEKAQLQQKTAVEKGEKMIVDALSNPYPTNEKIGQVLNHVVALLARHDRPLQEVDETPALENLAFKALNGTADESKQALETIEKGSLKAIEGANSFAFQGLDFLTKIPQDQWKFAADGTSGAILVKDSSLNGGGVALKFSDKEVVDAAVDIIQSFRAINHELQERGKDPLPFEAMNVMDVDISNVRQKDALVERVLGAVNDSRLTLLAQGHVKRIHSPNRGDQKDFALMKAEFLSDAVDFKKLTAETRVDLVKSNVLPRSLGAIMIVGRLLGGGLGDHVSLSPGNAKDPDFSTGKTNLSNIMWNADGEKPVLIDYDFLAAHRSDGASGYSEKHLTNSFQSFANFAAAKLATGNIAETLLALVQTPSEFGDNRHLMNPATDLLAATFTTGNDNLFQDGQEAELEKFSDQDKARYLANVLLGAITALEDVDAMRDVHINSGKIENATQVMDGIKAAVPNLADAKRQLETYLA